MEKKIKKIVYGLDELNDIGVYAISLVNMPAIEANFVALSSHVLLQEDKKRNMVYGPVLIPNKEILRVNDKGEEYLIEFPAETIQKAQEMFMKNGYQNEATYEHAVKINGVTVVESWIKESENDKSVHLGFDYPIGTWFVGQKVDNVELREKIMSGEVKGFSIEGYFSERESAALSSDQSILRELEILINTHK